ncbi:ABC transporter ATP-binding protein [Clostridium sp. D2Q-11]|uniref:ABC transporter ATP-binding protein n=1 Tax=Anaeromonas frigoriresistens TaxID=2683708 RepID=A0A942UTM9_9FIRM|nr:ABC transporter ATP-binding protein [Anaeromonas frigoriresistens]MBS4537220.1 ABC transporter ATP-binding protein [Anaeromonas frigoriresistens]
MGNIHEEEKLAKSYDSDLMKRLLSYAKPYWKYLLISVLLLMFVTLTELARPYIIKIAIDNNISSINQPMQVYDINESPIDGIEFQDKEYVRVSRLEDKQLPVNESNIYTLLKNNDNYYLVKGNITEDANDLEIIGDEEGNGGLRILSGEIPYNATLLSDSQYNEFREDDIKDLNILALIYFIIIVLGFIFNYVQVYLLNYTSKKIIYNIRQEIFSHIQDMSLSFFDKNPVGRLVTRVANDTEKLSEMYTEVLVNFFKDIFMLIGIVIIMMQMNIKLALMSFTVIPFILIASAIFRRKIRNVYRLVRIRLAKINSTLNENITGMKTIHIFSKEDKKFKEFDNINRDYFDASKQEVKIFALFRPSIEIIRSLGIALIVYYGGGNTISGVIEFGVLFAFINYLQKFFQPIMELTQKFNILQSAMASSERIFQILDKKEDIKNTHSPKALEKFNGKIEFKNVWFAYEKDNWVLKNVSFIINPGEAIAFVGATGAGKSSIISLINRFYDIQKGEILIDDINIKHIDKYSLRRRIGIVLQDVFLFTGDIKENIRLNKEDITMDQIKKVSKYVNAHSFISNLPQDYDEPVMERGSTLSSGQKQLLAFARALAYDPDILVLDEATSNIDTETEALIQDALLKLIKGRTSIAVAHRLSTIQHSNKIIVLHKGEVKEIGNHNELLDQGGMYYDLYRLQYKDDFSIDDNNLL